MGAVRYKWAAVFVNALESLMLASPHACSLSRKNGIRDDELFEAINPFNHTLRVLRDAFTRRLHGQTKSGDVVAEAGAGGGGGGGGDDDDDDDDADVDVELTRLTPEASDLEVVLHGFTALELSFTRVFKEVFAF